MNARHSAASVTLTQCVDLLTARWRAVSDELNRYPRPVTACDVDFNTLLVERAALVTALAELRPICRNEATVLHPREDH